MNLVLRREQTDHDRLSDIIVAAMETGNAGSAREAAAEHEEAFPDEIAAIRTAVLKDYGIRI